MGSVRIISMWKREAPVQMINKQIDFSWLIALVLSMIKKIEKLHLINVYFKWSRSLEVLCLDCVTAVDNRNRKLFSVNVWDFRFISL